MFNVSVSKDSYLNDVLYVPGTRAYHSAWQ
jgi:hypothetical protein